MKQPARFIRQPVMMVALCLYFLLSAFLAFFTLYLCFEIQWAGPFRDLWEFIEIIERQLANQWLWQDLLQPYGGIHRIPIPKLIFYLDYQFTNGNNLLALTISVLMQMLAFLVFVKAITTHQVFSFGEKLLLIATCLFCFFSTRQIYNLIYISDNQVPLTCTFTVFAACFFVVDYKNRLTLQLEPAGSPGFLFYLANIFIVLAAFSYSPGLMFWPAMILFMWLLRYPLKFIVMQAVFAAIIFTLYLSASGAPSVPEVTQQNLLMQLLSKVIAFIANLPALIRFFGIYLSSPTSKVYPLIGVLITYVSMAYVGALLWRLYVGKLEISRLTVFCLVLVFWIVLVGGVTAWGRLIYPNSAATERYQTLVMIYWAALLTLLYLDLRRNQLVAGIAVMILTVILLLPYQYKGAENMAWTSSRVIQAHTAAMSGIVDMKTISATLSHPLLINNINSVETHNEFFRQEKLAYFSHDLVDFMGQSFPNKTTNIVQCRVEVQSVDEINLMQGQYRLKGSGHWFDASNKKQPIQELLLLDEKQRVVGLGRFHRQKGDFLPSGYQGVSDKQWIAYINNGSVVRGDLSVMLITPEGFCEAVTLTKSFVTGF